MTDNLKKFLEEASRDADLAEQINTTQTIDAVISLAREKGYELTENNLKKPVDSVRQLLDENELDAVAGGKACACVFGGGGEASNYYKSRDMTCACVLTGVGYGADKTDADNTPVRCVCVGAGAGDLCVLHSDK